MSYSYSTTIRTKGYANTITSRKGYRISKLSPKATTAPRISCDKRCSEVSYSNSTTIRTKGYASAIISRKGYRISIFSTKT